MLAQPEQRGSPDYPLERLRDHPLQPPYLNAHLWGRADDLEA
jgi:hypothetical protein